jgi:hypothetical protein
VRSVLVVHALIWLAPLLAVLASFVPDVALAQSNRVVLVLAEEGLNGPLEAELLDALRAPLRELDVEVAVARAPGAPLPVAARRAGVLALAQHALAVIWLELRASELWVFVYDSTGHLYARDLPPDASAASQSEAIAIIVRSAVAAMLDGHAVSMAEVTLPAPAAAALPDPVAPPGPTRAPPEATRASAEDRAYLRVGLSYVGVVFDRHAPFQHGAAPVLVAAAPGAPWFVGADYTVFTAIELDGKGVTTRLQRHPFEVFAGGWLRTSSLHFDVRGALAADYMVRTTRRTDDGLRATAPHSRWLWSFSTRLGVAIPTWPRVHAIANLGAEFLINPYDQVISQTNASNEVVASPLVVRPRFELGVLVSTW